MPKLPDSTALGERIIPSGNRPIFSVDTSAQSRAAGAMGEAAFSVGQNLMRAGESQMQKQDLLNYSRAQSMVLQGKVRTDQLFQNDEDYATWGERYAEQLGKIKDEAAAQIRSPDLRLKFEISAGDTVARSVAGIQERARLREKDAGIAWLDKITDENLDIAFQTTDPEIRAGLLKAVHDGIDGAFHKGYIDAEKAGDRRRKVADKFAETYVASLPPAEAARLLAPGGRATPVPAKGGDAPILSRIAEIESGGRADAINPKTGAAGLFQFMPETAKQYGLTDPTDPEAATAAAAQLLNDNRAALTRALGREPTASELYLAHQQGSSGAAALLQNPDKPAAEVLTVVYGSAAKGTAAVVQNGGKPGMTAGEFSAMWGRKFDSPSTSTVPDDGTRAFSPTGTPVDFLDPKKRFDLYRQAQAKVEEQTRAQIAAQEKAERDAEKILKFEADEFAKEGWDRKAAGNLTVDWLQQNRSVFSEPDYRALLHAATSEDTIIEDNETVIDLRTRLDLEDVSVDAARALREKKIKVSTYTAIVGQNRSALKDDQPESPYKSGRELVRATLDPTNLVTGAAAQIAKAGMANALSEFDDWSVANPKATRQEYQTEARAIIQRYQIVSYEQMSLSQGLPRMYRGTRGEMSVEALDAAESETIQQLDSGRLSEAQASQELQKIENWRAILRAKPTVKK